MQKKKKIIYKVLCGLKVLSVLSKVKEVITENHFGWILKMSQYF